MHAPTMDDVARIADVEDPVSRNLQITQCYHELSGAMARMGPASANWCTFATWASRQAGQSIRQEDLARAFERRFGASPEVLRLVEAVARHTGAHVLPAALQARIDLILRAIGPEELFERVSDAVARGNKKVFEEIGQEFARFLADFRNATRNDPEKTAAFCAKLRPGDPPGGQDRLREAFTAYVEARFSSDPALTPQLAFMANLLVGFHEQTRLQPEIEEALNAPFAPADAARQRILRILLPGAWMRVRHHVARLLGRPLPLDRVVDQLIAEVKRMARQVVTRALMTLHLPDNEVLHLGRDLTAGFPPSLLALTHPPLIQLLAQIDPTPDSLRHSGAADWADFEQRIHFIADFFRCYHERPALFQPPGVAQGGRV